MCLTYRERAPEADEVVASCTVAGRRVLAIRDALGPITTLVNNAGVVAPKSRVDEMDRDRIRRMFDVNVVGAFLCAREAIGPRRRRSTP